VADGQLAGQFVKHRGGEDIRHVAHGLLAVDLAPSLVQMPALSWPRCCSA
jgi:hypothetical protein